MSESAIPNDATIADSVVIAVPADESITGNPTGNVSLSITRNVESVHTVLAGPASGSPATPAFRQLSNTDLTGLGAAAVENLGGSIIDDGSGNLKIANSGVTAGTHTTLSSITIGLDGRITSYTA